MGTLTSWNPLGHFLVQGSPTDCGASLCVMKKPCTRGGYSTLEGYKNTNTQWVVAPVKRRGLGIIILCMLPRPLLFYHVSLIFPLQNLVHFNELRTA
jgi:hypothetical protein